MTRYALVPVDATEEMQAAATIDWWDAEHFREDWTAMLAASPGGGRVTAEMAEKAAAAHSGAPFPSKRARERMRAALAAIGLQVEGDGQ